MAYIVLILTAILWGLTPLAVKIGLHGFSPFGLCLLRFLVALIAVILIFIIRGIKLPNRQKIPQVMFISVFTSLNMAFFSWGIQYTTTLSGALIYTVFPVITAVFSYLLFKEKLNFLQIIGIIVTFAGLLLIIFLPIIEKGEILEIGSFQGNFVVFLGAVSFSIYTLGSRHLSRQYSPLTIASISIFTSFLVFSVLSLIEVSKQSFNFNITDLNSVSAITYLGLGSTLSALLLFQWLVRVKNAFIASLNQYLQTVVTIAAGMIFLKEKTSPLFFFGAALVILGVFMASNVSSKIKGRFMRVKAI